jgi:hypothetical protein
MKFQCYDVEVSASNTVRHHPKTITGIKRILSRCADGARVSLVALCDGGQEEFFVGTVAGARAYLADGEVSLQKLGMILTR